jgi:zinc protease
MIITYFNKPFKNLNAFLISFLLFIPIAAQKKIEPHQEQLLNGLNLLILPDTTESKVLLSLRIHSGAIFDLAGKEGTMALLGDALVPEPVTRQFIREDLGGQAEVVTTYDHITFTLSGNQTQFEKLLEILRSSIINTPLSVEEIKLLRDNRIKVVKELESSPSTIADKLIISRLFGKYPYGRPIVGIPESLMKVERSDLLLARDRFLIPNNSTLTIIGGVDQRRAIRGVRQLLGSWRRSEQIVPPTFQIPEAPSTRTLIFDLPGAQSTEIRIATRGFIRSDRDQITASLIAQLIRDRWQKTFPEFNKYAFYAQHHPYAITGTFTVGVAVPTKDSIKAIESVRNLLTSIITTSITAPELARLKNDIVVTLSKKNESMEETSQVILDTEKSKLSIIDQIQLINSLTPTEIRRVANRLFQDASLVTVVVGSFDQMQSDLKKLGEVECINSLVPPASSNSLQAPTKRP